MDYWIITIPTYGKFVFYGLEIDACEAEENKERWEHCIGSIHKADRNNPADLKLVQEEILATEFDRKNQPNIPWLPREGWF